MKKMERLILPIWWWPEHELQIYPHEHHPNKLTVIRDITRLYTQLRFLIAVLGRITSKVLMPRLSNRCHVRSSLRQRKYEWNKFKFLGGYVYIYIYIHSHYICMFTWQRKSFLHSIEITDQFIQKSFAKNWTDIQGEVGYFATSSTPRITRTH